MLSQKIMEYWDTSGVITFESDAAQEYACWKEASQTSEGKEFRRLNLSLQDFEEHIGALKEEN